MGIAKRACVAVAALTVAATGLANAQETRSDAGRSPRHGLYVSAGVGGGSVGFECSVCLSDKRTDGAAGFLGLGGTLSPHWRLGAEADVWGRREGGVERAAVAIQFVAAWYPSRTGGFFVKAGLGGLAHVEDNGLVEVSAAGGSFMLGIGCDLRIAGSLAITPYVTSIVTSRSTVQVNNVKIPGVEVNPNLAHIGLALSLL